MNAEQTKAVVEELNGSNCHFFCYTTKEGKVRRVLDASDQDLANMLFTIFKQDKILLEVVTKIISVFKDKEKFDSDLAKIESEKLKIKNMPNKNSPAGNPDWAWKWRGFDPPINGYEPADKKYNAFKHCFGMYCGIGDFDYWIISEVEALNKKQKNILLSLLENDKDEKEKKKLKNQIEKHEIENQKAEEE